MKLYHSGTSPYVRKVMFILELAGKTGEVELVPGSGTPLEPNEATCTVNPIGKVPCLITDEGLAVYDSRVICQYLDHKFGLGLYPEGAAKYPVMVTEALSDGILDAALLGVYEGRLRPEEVRFQPWVDAQLVKINRGLRELDALASGFGDAVDAGQIAAACTLGYLDFRYGDLGWRESCPALASWYGTIAERPEMTATVPG